MSGHDNHYSVMLDEAIKALFVRENGKYADCTYGRGGHSRAILSALGPEGVLLTLDSDLDAVRHAKKTFANDSRVIVEHSAFSKIKKIVEKHNLTGLDGVLLDLGVSSPQLDNAERGFSFRLDGPLDMRLDRTAGKTAADWLQKASQKEIEEVLKNYGEERYFRRIARALVTERDKYELDSTGDLAEVVKKAIPKEIAPFVPAVAGMFLGPAVSGILGNLGAGLAAKGGIGSLVGKALTNKMVAGGLGRALVDVGTQALTSDRISPASALLSGGLGALSGYQGLPELKQGQVPRFAGSPSKLRIGLDKALKQGAKLGRVGNLGEDFDLFILPNIL